MNVTTSNSPDIVVCGGDHDFLNRITRNGEPYDVSLKAVTATVRYEGRPGRVIDETLEAIEVVSIDEHVQDDEGNNVQWALSPEMSDLLEPFTPVQPSQVAWFTVQYFVEEDNFAPDLLRFRARRSGNDVAV